MVSKKMFLLLLYYLVVFAGSGAGCRNLFSGLIFASSIESLKSAHTSKFTSFCKSVELASEVLYVLCKYADFFLCTAQTNVFGAKIGMSAKRSKGFSNGRPPQFCQRLWAELCRCPAPQPARPRARASRVTSTTELHAWTHHTRLMHCAPPFVLLAQVSGINDL